MKRIFIILLVLVILWNVFLQFQLVDLNSRWYNDRTWSLIFDDHTVTQFKENEMELNEMYYALIALLKRIEMLENIIYPDEM